MRNCYNWYDSYFFVFAMRMGFEFPAIAKIGVDFKFDLVHAIHTVISTKENFIRFITGKLLLMIEIQRQIVVAERYVEEKRCKDSFRS